MEPVKDEIHKLPKLRSVELPVEKILKKTRKYLCTIGEHIEDAVKGAPLLTALQCWEYVSAYAHTNKSGQKYMEMYEVIKREKAKSRPGPSNSSMPAQGVSNVVKNSLSGLNGQSRRSPLGVKRKAEPSSLGREKAARFGDKRHRGRYSPDPNEPSTVCRSVMDYMKLFGDDKDRLQRLEEVNSLAYRKRAMR